jgi:arylsulfatase A-like enzyme
VERVQLQHFLIEEQASQIERDLLERIILYDAEIRFVDSELERLFEAIEGEATAGSSLWIVTSDHGQGLANHDWFGHHRFIYNEHLRVPLLFHFTDGSVPPRVISDQLVELVDVPVTLLDILGETFDHQVAPIQGRSLVPFLRGDQRYRHKDVAFGERRRTYLRTRKPSQEPGERYALQTLREKYLLYSEGEDEFYDLSADPYETTNLIDSGNPMEEKLRRELERLIADLRAEGSAEMVDEEVLERLESLGYVD